MAPTVEVPPTICSDTCASAPNAVTICLPPGAPRTTGRGWPLADQGWQPALTCPHPTGQIGGQRELHASPKNKEQRGETVSSSRAGLCPLGSPRSPPLSPAGGIPHLHCLQNPKLLEVAPLLLLSDPKCHTLPGGGALSLLGPAGQPSVKTSTRLCPGPLHNLTENSAHGSLPANGQESVTPITVLQEKCHPTGHTALGAF